MLQLDRRLKILEKTNLKDTVSIRLTAMFVDENKLPVTVVIIEPDKEMLSLSYKEYLELENHCH